MPEELKPITLVTEPDPRFEGYTMREQGTGIRRSITIADHHRWIAEVTLRDSVPAHIRQAFTTGQNLTLYAWFVYPFLSSAQLHFAGCIENAFRVKLRVDSDWSAKHGLGELLRLAQKARVLEGVRFGTATELGWMPSPEAGENYKEWFFAKAAGIIQLVRNGLAHGRPMLLPDGGAFMQLTADTINHLFAPERDT